MKKLKISFIINIIIFILSLLGTIFMLTGFHFMSDDVILEVTKLEAFKFFTVDSNVLMGLISLLFAFYEYQIIKNKVKIIPKEIYVMKLIFTVSVMLTFFITTFYLAPFSSKGFWSMFQNSNLFFHLIIPILSLITFVFFENTNKIKFKYTAWGLLPTFIYAIFYVVNIYIHIENNKVSYLYDWYGFAQGSLVSIIIVFALMHIITYVICVTIWFFNKKLKKENKNESINY